MSGIAAIIDWDRDRADPADLAARLDLLLGASPHRGTDGSRALVDGACALGRARRFTSARERIEANPVMRRGLAVAGDLRIDNRDDLRRALGEVGSAAGDAELVLSAYERWGTGLAERLVGDFAFVLWSAAERRLYAARDPFGVRPMCFRATPDRLALASEVGALLAHADRPGLSDERILAYLTGEPPDPADTFFAGVRRLPPGHFLVASRGGVRVTRYFLPPTTIRRFASPAGCDEAFRHELRLALSSRLDADTPIVAHLSGGLDSSAIACLAGEIHGGAQGGIAPVHLVSACFPGLDCDETGFQHAVTRRLGFPAHRYDATVASPGEDGVDPATPERWHEIPVTAGWHRLGRSLGARVALSGMGGDQLLFERGIFRDLAAHGRLGALAREAFLAPRYSTRSPWFFLQDGLRALAPPLARDLWRRLRPGRRPPWWLGPRLRRAELAPPRDTELEFVSHTQRATFGWLTEPGLAATLESEERSAARAGIELRYPFLDPRLARFVLGIHWEHRLPGGRMKRLLRTSLADLLPGEIAARRQVTQFGAALCQFVRQRLPRLERLVSGSTWASEPYVEQRGARRLLVEFRAHPTWDLGRTVYDIGMLEDWLRAG